MLKNDYWHLQQLNYIQAFSDALPKLQTTAGKKVRKYSHEDEISRDLYLALSEVIFSGRYKSLTLGLPTFQSQSQPSLKKKGKQKYEDKRPDFLWSYVDYINRDRKDFHVECKRLKETKAQFSKEYVHNGVNRFIKKEWSYGIGCANGLMIGFVEELTINDFVKEIAAHLSLNSLPTLMQHGSKTGKRAFYKHQLARKFISAKFDLFHFFVEIKVA